MILEQCKIVNCEDLGENFQTHIYLQDLASIQPRTSPVKFARSRRHRHIHAPAKNHGAPNGRAAAILKLKNKPYLNSYTDHQKGQVCERLDMELMKKLKSIFVLTPS